MANKIFNKHLKRNKINFDNDFPEVILIDSTSFCNLRCSMCFHYKMTRKKGIMTWEIYTKIIDEVADANKNVRIWMIFFGEPFILAKIEPTIFERIAYAKSKGLTDVVMNSNGNLMDKDASQKLIDSKLDAIYFGVDALTQETYKKLRVGGNHDKVVSNILYLLALKKKLKAKKPEVVIQFVEMKENKHEKDDFIKFWSKKGVTVKIRPMVSWAGKVEAPNLRRNDNERWPCHWSMKTMSITDQGKVVLCAVDLDARFVAGDIHEKSLKKIWNSSLKKMRELQLSKKFDKLPDFCKNCNDWQSVGVDFYSPNK